MNTSNKEDQEVEIIPLSPIRRLERRVEKIESTTTKLDPAEFFRELIAIIRMNQEIVDEMAKANDSLRIELSKLPSKIDDLTKNLTELLNYIRAATIEESHEISSETFKPLADKMDQLIETNKKIIETNDTITSVLESIEKRLKPLPPRPPILRPLLR